MSKETPKRMVIEVDDFDTKDYWSLEIPYRDPLPDTIRFRGKLYGKSDAHNAVYQSSVLPKGRIDWIGSDVIVLEKI